MRLILLAKTEQQYGLIQHSYGTSIVRDLPSEGQDIPSI